MINYDAIYDEGCIAGRGGADAKQNPYPQDQKADGVYSMTPHDRWEAGRQRGKRWCPLALRSVMCVPAV